MSEKSNFTFFESMAIGGLAACMAEVCAIPIGTVKVRMHNFQDIYLGVFQTYKKIFQEEGFFAFYRGLRAGLLRQISYASLRVGIYDFSIQELENKKIDITILHQVIKLLN